MPTNDDQVLGDQFDQELTNFISELTLSVKKPGSTLLEKKKATLEGKRNVMSLVVEKLLEYLKFSDSQCENIVSDIATQYESLID